MSSFDQVVERSQHYTVKMLNQLYLKPERHLKRKDIS